MEIRIRGVDPSIVYTIDEYAKTNNLSRNNYIKKLLMWQAERNVMESARLKEDAKMKSTYQINEIVLKKIKELEFNSHQILALNIYNSGLDAEELEEILNTKVVEGED